MDYWVLIKHQALLIVQLFLYLFVADYFHHLQGAHQGHCHHLHLVDPHQLHQFHHDHHQEQLKG